MGRVSTHPDLTARDSRARDREAGRAATRVVEAQRRTARALTRRVRMRRASTVPRPIADPVGNGPLGRVPAVDRAARATVRRGPAASGHPGRVRAGSVPTDPDRTRRARTSTAAPARARAILPTPPGASGSQTMPGLPSRHGRAADPAAPAGIAPAVSGRAPAARGRATDRARGSNRGSHLARVPAQAIRRVRNRRTRSRAKAAATSGRHRAHSRARAASPDRAAAVPPADGRALAPARALSPAPASALPAHVRAERVSGLGRSARRTPLPGRSPRMAARFVTPRRRKPRRSPRRRMPARLGVPKRRVPNRGSRKAFRSPGRSVRPGLRSDRTIVPGRADSRTGDPTAQVRPAPRRGQGSPLVRRPRI